MECKKDEAISAKDRAENLMKENDFGGALELALKAKNLFPGLDGVTQLVDVLNILAVHEKKVNGEVNWYAVLDAYPSADRETLKKHYRLLAFALHPDNNKSTWAYKAFEIVSKAWNLLSNKATRGKYNKKMRNMWNYADMSPPVPTGCNARPLWTFSKTKLAPPYPSDSNTFSTKCSHCMTQYIYRKLYCNKVVLCPGCRKPFLAIDSCYSPQHPASGETYASTIRCGRGANIRYGEEGTILPNSDFHDFGEDIKPDLFDKYKVWAVYDGEERMPRLYAWIRNVISKIPFKVEINWLGPVSSTKNLVSLKYPITSGDFRLVESDVCNELNLFSHDVYYRRGPSGSIRIYPRMGEVWALYKNWSSDWNVNTSDEVIQKYEMVELLDDFRVILGGSVTPLLKLEGFNSVFHRHSGPGQIRSIPAKEISRFSHRVPSRVLTGLGAANCARRCWELDPAAMPDDIDCM